MASFRTHEILIPMLNPHESDILERLKHPEQEAERRKVSRSLYLRNVLNSIFILLALVAMVGIGLNWGSIAPTWCYVVALIAVLVKIAEAALRMPSMLQKPRGSRFDKSEHEATES